MNTPFDASGVARLSHWSVLRATGADAVSFLQGQLTNDVATLAFDQVRRAGFCSAKGRLQASFLVWRPGPEEVLLACSTTLLPALLKRLSMFVLRARCKLADAHGELGVWGIAGDAADALLSGTAPGRTRSFAGGTAIALDTVDGVARALLVAAHAPGLPDDLAVQPSIEPDRWRLGEVRSGIALIEAATVDRFVPQMLNWELVDGVDFQKGCYPGQEVVARSQYRGTTKRRMFLFETEGPANAADDVFHSTDPGQPAGMVVNTAAIPGGTAMLVEVKLAALDGGTLHLRSSDGPAIVRIGLPYTVPTDVATSAG
jgi:tRNA-modifying protein YgfZ